MTAGAHPPRRRTVRQNTMGLPRELRLAKPVLEAVDQVVQLWPIRTVPARGT